MNVLINYFLLVVDAHLLKSLSYEFGVSLSCDVCRLSREGVIVR